MFRILPKSKSKKISSDSGVPLTDVGGIGFDDDIDALEADDHDFRKAKEESDEADDEFFGEAKESVGDGTKEQEQVFIELERHGMQSFNTVFLRLRDLCVEESKASEIKVVKKGFFRFTPQSMSEKEEIDESDTPLDLQYFVLEKKLTKCADEKKQESKRFVFFSITKDADTHDNEKLLCSIGKLLEVFHPQYEQYRKVKFCSASKIINCVPNPAAETDEFAKAYLDESKADEFLLNEKRLKSTFVFPMRQCRGFFYNRRLKSSLPILGAAHIVLAVYDASTNLLNCFDSKPKLKLPGSAIPIIYPEKFKTFSEWMHVEPITYLGTQKDQNMCGYFVHTEMSLIAVEGSTKNLGKICLPPVLIQSLENYVDNWPEIHKKVFAHMGSGQKIEDPYASSIFESSLSSLILHGKFAFSKLAEFSQSAVSAWQKTGAQTEDKEKNKSVSSSL